jgi:predicted nucleic acid-binding Zn ribbon protein
MMQRFDDNTDGLKEQVVDFEDAEFEEALKNFKSSVHAWSDAAYSRPRTVAREVRVRSWRLAAGWALGCVLVAGSVSGGLMERHHRAELARIAAQQRAVEQARQLQQQQARAKITDEVLLADVDSAVSRQVPDAMEPLAQMMADDETK